ncbi:flavodoxin [Bordetella pertussis]|uniref:NADPH-dependent FMN reductase-like domain-containing protein n=20 Tax=Bordetella TaxID=517 RepID=Q7VTF5_BORPE|nr:MULTISPECIES: NAD(P)H-dependent oxidoreductase [Bordetella]ETH39452.1 flavin reductase domain protein [Bordetella pertussis H918]ETH43013.1 flavin reductase domain protein [Bordetella pertussis H939]ETH47182.1 flavin reductase domain protein [Bordetella pertussis H921]ETH70253.1 flavin reductase domain protein [Bordetella pertussis STO1-CHLA-0011]ETH88427.1 flavin reductase domain protein [Bordetella pertussis STO1-CHOC-0018]ETH92002.1 flavin reductase domain protein [Bordetella pertussis 
MKTLLIAWHSRTGAARQMAQALERGALAAALALEQPGQLRVRRQAASRTDAAALLAADGYLFCAPENLGSLSGAMKECFDRCYYGVLDRIQGRPYGVAISAGTDGEGAARQVERICTGWRLRAAAPPLIARSGAQTPEQIAAPKQVPADVLARCEELGGLLAATLLMGS